MIKTISIIFIINVTLLGQSVKIENKLLTPDNVRKFADYLFCQHDYLRSAEEYKRYLRSTQNDTVKFLIGESYCRIGNYSAAAAYYKSVLYSDSLGSLADLNYLKSIFQEGRYDFYRNNYNSEKLNKDNAYYLNALSLYNFSYLLSDDVLPKKKDFIKPFNPADRKILNKFYDFKSDPPYKSPVKAAIFSAIIPGAGKIYTHQYTDGIVAFLTTGVLSYIAYMDFRADHKFRGWLFTALSAGFYAGNIYGSAASAQIFNTKIRFDFFQDLKTFLNKVNYFVPSFDFCR